MEMVCSVHVPIHVLSKDCQSISGSWQGGWCDQMLLYNVYLKNYPASVDVWLASLLNFALSSAFLFQSALTCLALFAKAATKIVLATSANFSCFQSPLRPLNGLQTSTIAVCFPSSGCNWFAYHHQMWSSKASMDSARFVILCHAGMCLWTCVHMVLSSLT